MQRAMNTEFVYPTFFTAEQLERMAALVSRENSKAPNRDDHNLARKLSEYARSARQAVRPMPQVDWDRRRRLS